MADVVGGVGVATGMRGISLDDNAIRTGSISVSISRMIKII
jgi:hypothetical protein